MKRPSDKVLARHEKVLHLRLQVVRLQQRVRQLEEGCMQAIADIGAEQLAAELSARHPAPPPLTATFWRRAQDGEMIDATFYDYDGVVRHFVRLFEDVSGPAAHLRQEERRAAQAKAQTE